MPTTIYCTTTYNILHSCHTNIVFCSSAHPFSSSSPRIATPFIPPSPHPVKYNKFIYIERIYLIYVACVSVV